VEAASQTIIGIIFWPLTLTGIFYPYFRDRTDNFGLGAGSVLGGMLVLFFMIVAFIVVFGVLFDKLRFWKEQNIVLIERNPYAGIKLNAKEVYWVKMWALSLKANPALSPEMRKELELYDRWIDYNIREDKFLQDELERIRAAISAGPAGPDKTA
jgi:hypothetical protein